MSVLHVKSPNGTQTNLDLNKVATTDGFTMGNEKAIKFQYGSIYTRTHGHPDTDSGDSIFNQLLLSADPNPEAWLSGGAKIALRGYTSNDDGADGGFTIYTSDGTNHIALEGNPYGSLQWESKPIEVVNQWSYEMNGYVKYKSGFIFQYGIIDVVSGAFTVVYPISFINHWNVVLSNDGVWVVSSSASSFNINGASNNVYWLAMGC